MNSNEIYWVFGSSASGKETFVLNASNNNSEIIELMKWNNKKIIPIMESINYIKQYNDDPIGDKRVEIVKSVMFEVNSNNNSIILIKGQNVDFRTNLVGMLKKKLPEVKQSIIFLHTDLIVNYQRAKKKPWFKKYENDINSWRVHQKNSANYVKNIIDFEIISIDTTSGYKLTKFPTYN